MSVRDTVSRFLDGRFKGFASLVSVLQGVKGVEIGVGAYASTTVPPAVSLRQAGGATKVLLHEGSRTTTNTATDEFASAHSTRSSGGSSLTCTAASPNVSGPANQFVDVVAGDYFYIKGDPGLYTVATKTDNQHLILSANVETTSAGSGVWESATPGVIVNYMLSGSAFQALAAFIGSGWPNLTPFMAVETGGARPAQWNTNGAIPDLYARADLGQILYKLEGFSNGTVHWRVVDVAFTFSGSTPGVKGRFCTVSSAGNKVVLGEVDSSGPTLLTLNTDLIPYGYAHILELFIDNADLVDIDPGPTVGQKAPEAIMAVSLRFRRFADV
jgi:hypothetical protein